MKDYNLFLDLNGKDELRKKFILRYEIMGKYNGDQYKKIVIHFADGKKYTLPYSLENEKQVLLKMKNQFNEYKLDMLLWKKGKNFNVNFINGIVKITTFLLTIGVISLLMSSHSLAFCIGLTFGIIGGIGALISWPLKIIADKQMEDFEKHMLFFENEMKINQILKDNDNILVNINEQTRDKVKDEFGRINCTINTIDKMTLKELRELLETFKRDEIIFKEENKRDKYVKKIKSIC